MTGAGRGIGAGIALALACERANVVVSERDVEGAKRVVKNMVSSGGKAISFKADVTNEAQVQAMVEETTKKFGTVDILVNSAGIEALRPLCRIFPRSNGIEFSALT